ncbi:hypothetical protein SDC9_07429 [bioreactor metagenome]|uniref:Uncharacterized protein n=1 Tax=bioreactor metagenome TaxID=1076179 RepID=A0A644T4S0_9ZZZZ|nr:hypothetical protein [Methanobrevibacter sp.]MEA4956886.1 hypothetical protein [Methanobrevibacter sp.]
MNNHKTPCPQEPRITKLETQHQQIKEDIKELKQVDTSLKDTLTRLDKTVTRFSTIVDNILKTQNKETLIDKLKAPVLTAIIVAVALKLMQWY